MFSEFTQEVLSAERQSNESLGDINKVVLIKKNYNLSSIDSATTDFFKSISSLSSMLSCFFSVPFKLAVLYYMFNTSKN